jgi:hypothetical protein
MSDSIIDKGINMDRQTAIDTIGGLYPIDSQFEDTIAIGERLLARAKRECDDWRNLPDAILFRYAELCQQEEERSTRQLLRKVRG